MPHCPLTKAAPLTPLKLRCEKSTLLHSHCSYLKCVCPVPHKSLAAISILQPLESRGNVLSLFPCGLELSQMHGWAQRSIISICFVPPFIWGLRSHHRHSELETQCSQGFMLEYLWPGKCHLLVWIPLLWRVFLLNYWVSSEKQSCSISVAIL